MCIVRAALSSLSPAFWRHSGGGSKLDRNSALTEEQGFLDVAVARRDTLIGHLRDELETDATDAVEVARRRMLRRQYEELRRAAEGLVFGRLDAVDGTVRHVGRIGLPAADGSDPLLLDWRAPAARPFYTATAVDPQGQARRRHIRTTGSVVIGVDDEPLDGRTGGLAGQGALLAALDERRTGRMTSAIATLQREQDDIIRASASGPLIVQGGPGTGKTVVALHRVAYLLFTHQHMAERAVLLLGPSTRFLDYIGQVLPALGETAVVAATCDTLVPGVAVDRTEDRVVAEIKGRAIWQDALERRVSSLTPRPRPLQVRWDGEFHTIPASVMTVSGRSYHRSRALFAAQLHQALASAVAAHRETLLESMDHGYEDILRRFDDDGDPSDYLMSEEEIDELAERIAEDATIGRFVESVWPTLTPEAVLRSVLADPDHLTPAEAAAVTAEPAEGWAPSDIPLLDAVADLIGSGSPASSGPFTADRARATRDWVYGHIVVDEAQELSEMQWQMVLRRCPSRSITAVGDIDQAEAAHRHTGWAQAVGAAFGDRWTAAELTVCYRTPREVMALTGPVLAAAGSRNTPPRAVRSSGIEPWQVTVTETELPDAVAQAVPQMRERWNGGTVGVIASARLVPMLRPFVGDAPLLTATQAKGLEWDATLLVDAAGIAAEPRGHNGLYVALTRCTQELGQLNVNPG